MQHHHGECFTNGAATAPCGACLDCLWRAARQFNENKISFELSDDYQESLIKIRKWLDKRASRGLIAHKDLIAILRGLRFRRMSAGQTTASEGLLGIFWAKLYHEGGGLFEGFGESLAEAIGDAVEGYLAKIAERNKPEVMNGTIARA